MAVASYGATSAHGDRVNKAATSGRVCTMGPWPVLRDQESSLFGSSPRARGPCYSGFGCGCKAALGTTGEFSPWQ